MSSTPEEAQLAAHYASQARKRIMGQLTPRWSSHPRDWRYADTSVPLEKALAQIAQAPK